MLFTLLWAFLYSAERDLINLSGSTRATPAPPGGASWTEDVNTLIGPFEICTGIDCGIG